jgi:hypothetical protein
LIAIVIPRARQGRQGEGLEMSSAAWSREV